MNIIAFFTENGVPRTGLVPVLDVWELDGTHVIVLQDMTEVAGGFYYYDFVAYAPDVDYVIRADGGATLSILERYVESSNEVPINTSVAVENIPTLVEIEASTVLAKQEELLRVLGLMQENHFMDNAVYDTLSNLTSARIRIYSVAGSVGTDNDVLSTYNITATYQDRNLDTFGVIKV